MMNRRSATSDRSAVRQARALAIQDIERCCRNWLAFLAEKRAELAQRQMLDEDDLLVSPQSAQPRKARLLPAVRDELTAVLRMRQQQAQEQAETTARQAATAAPDPDTVYTALLNRIGDELEGKCHPQGFALVWYEGELHEFNHQAVMRATSDDDYLTVAGDRALPDGKRMVLAAVGGVAALLLMAGFFYWMFLYEPAAATVSGAVQVTIGQQAVTLWDATSAAIGPVAGRITARSGYPLRLCLTPEQQRAATAGATLVVTGTESVRFYRLAPPAATPADALVQDCGSAPPRTVAAAQLTNTRTHQELDTTQVMHISVWGPDTDPATIPPDRMVVDLTTPDASGAEGTLILADGSRYASTTSSPTVGGVIVRYLVPFSPAAQRAGYERVRPGALPAVLPLDLPAPTSRAALLRKVMRVSDPQAAIVSRDGVPTLALTLTVSLAADAAPLTLIPADVTIASQNGAALANTTWTPPALTPGATQTIQVALPLTQSYAALDVALAGWRARVNLKETP
jgi:hypothetical protein